MKSFNYIVSLKSNSKIKAIGEIGLDYFYYKEDNDREKQRLWFKNQVELANELNLKKNYLYQLGLK